MYIERRYKKLLWFDFLDQMEVELKRFPSKEKYIELLDEIRLRRLESVSEGGTYKLKAPAKELFSKFERRMSEDQSFASTEDLNDCKNILEDIL